LLSGAFDLASLAAAAAVSGYQFPFFYIKFSFFISDPFVKAIFAQCVSLVLDYRLGLLEWNDIRHDFNYRFS